jgi:hypothetical protein
MSEAQPSCDYTLLLKEDPVGTCERQWAPVR